METNTAQYDAHSALTDAARTRVAIAEKTQVLPLDYLLNGIVGLAFVAASFNALVAGWPGYLVAAIPLLVLIPVSMVQVRRVERTGTQQGWGRVFSTTKGALVLLGIGFVAYIGSMVVRDRMDLSNTIAVVGAVVFALSYLAATWWIDRAARRQLTAARAELAALEQA